MKDKIKLFTLYWKYKWWKFSLIIDLYYYKLQYILLINKYIYKLLFYFKNNKIINKFIISLKIIWIYIKKDFHLLKKNLIKFKLFHRNMRIIFVPFYIFFFLAGLVPFIYILIIIYFIWRYSFKYIYICLELYMFFYNEEDIYNYKNIYMIEYKNTKKNINIFFMFFKGIYIKIDKYLFKMERKKKIKEKIFIWRVLIWNKYVEIAQRNIDKFDNFVLVRFPELWFEFEKFLYDLIIKSYIYKARLIRKITEIRLFIKHWPLYKRKKIFLFKLFIIKIKYYIRKHINYEKFKLEKYLRLKYLLSYLLIKDYFNDKYYIFRFFIIKFLKKLKWRLIMIIHPWFWDYIVYLYAGMLYYSIRAVLFYTYPIYPFFCIYYSILDVIYTPRMTIDYTIMYLRSCIHITYYFFLRIYCYLYKFDCYVRYKLYNIYYRIIILIKSILWISYYFIKYANRKFYRIITYFFEQPAWIYFRYWGLTRRCLLYLDLCSYFWFWYRRPRDEVVIQEYRKFPYFYFIEHRRYIFNTYVFFCRIVCFKKSLIRHEGMADFFDIYDVDVYYHQYYTNFAPFDKFIYKYPTENMCIYNQYWFILKPGNKLVSRFY